MARIETGVDKLVALVAKRKKIAVDEAAKELGVSPVIIQEWADFLEEEGTLSIEYSLSKVYLLEKRLTKKEIEGKARDYEDKKDAFVRKVEVALEHLDRETATFEKIKEEFLKLKEGLGGEMDKIQTQLTEIHHFENLRKNIDDEIGKQRTEYNQILDDAQKRITVDQKKYEEVIGRIEKEKGALRKERDDVQEIQKEEDSLKEKLDAILSVVSLIDKKLKEEKNVVENSEKKITALERFAEKVEDEIKKKKTDVITPLLEMAEQHKDKIHKVQDEIIQKLKEKKNDIELFSSEGTLAAKRFEEFFKKKTEIDDLFSKIDENKNELKKEMEDLIEKAKVFNVIASDTQVKKSIGELLKKYEDVQERKEHMRKNIEKLFVILKTH
ncbi:MAG: hypothetical protein ABIJ21_05500 [Nanoarchaeota archaeon]